MLSTIDDERGSKIARNSGFDCHLSPVGRQMAIEKRVFGQFLTIFYLHSLIISTFSIATYPVCLLYTAFSCADPNYVDKTNMKIYECNLESIVPTCTEKAPIKHTLQTV